MRRASLRGKLILFSTLSVLFVGFVFAKLFFLDSKNAEGQIKILSSPKTSVFINNVATGKATPYENTLKTGEYLIKLIPNEATQAASWQGRVKIYKNTLTYINRELGSSDVTSAGEVFTTTKMNKRPDTPNTGQVQVETDPTGAIVNLDNEEKGVAPLVLSDVPQGTHELSVRLPGFFPRVQKINIDSGYIVFASFKLAIDQSQKLINPEKIKTKESSQSATTKIQRIKIKITETGFLRVRIDPSVDASESGQVKPGDEFDVLEEKSGWYKIEFQDNKEGWVSGEYVEKI